MSSDISLSDCKIRFSNSVVDEYSIIPGYDAGGSDISEEVPERISETFEVINKFRRNYTTEN
jgi:hypothetical protein